MNKITKKILPLGFISTLHTFGRDLKWNPHIHVLITEGASGNFTPWKKFEVFPYIMLRNRFQTALLSMLEKHFGKETFKTLNNHIYNTSKNGFYVHAPKVKHRDIKSTVKYVIRYSGKLAMAQSRILDYDGEYVTFWYDRHEDNQHITEKFMLINSLNDSSFTSMINISMLLDTMGFMQKSTNTLINLIICLSLMLLNSENSSRTGDVVLNYILNMTLFFVLVDTPFTLTILFKNRIILPRRCDYFEY